MKKLLFVLGLGISGSVFTQNKFPDFLVGTWFSEDQSTYEHWDKLSPSSMKGYSYVVKNGEIKVNEYLDLIERKDGTFYIPTVIGQNNGKPVEFKLTSSDSAFVFENKTHDFPKKICYKMLSATEVFVQVLGDKNTGFSFKMTKKEPLAETINEKNATDNPKYDKVLAEKLQGDDYGMKSYVFVALKTGTNTTTDKKYIDSCFTGHMGNIGRLVDEGKLIVAGPFGKNDLTYRGLFIFNVKTKEEAEALLKTDPAVNSGLLAYDLIPWYGSAALSEYLDASDKIWRKKF
ncbi:YciI family protein [Fluviicola chungangensis]|uniref:YCII-related domain-containing protein n=1 Tax=Fluviicola chungangensis TaxID=2597671 RepID=A0A556N117_9FLAO|nr:DUF6265 family protein [Fluviicola chungangensis]TSJ45729.1 hypothetical protein FO442_08245 [Fluviicola chungangensis]